MRNTLLALVVLFLGASAKAEFSAVTVAGSVRTYDTKTVVLRINQRDVRLPRELVIQRDLKKGDAVLVTLRGAQIRYLLNREIQDGARVPASSEKPGKPSGN